MSNLPFVLKGFLSARQLSPNTPIKIIREELEPTEFKQYFASWETTVPFGMTQTYHAGQGIATRGTFCSSRKYPYLPHKRGFYFIFILIVVTWFFFANI